MTISAPCTVVWQRLQLPDTWAGLGPVDRVWDARTDGEGALLGYRWSARAGGRLIEGSATAVESLPPRLMVLVLDAGDVGGELRAELEGVQDTDLVVSMDIEPKGPLAFLFFPAVARVIGDGFPDHVEEFAAGFAA